MKSPKSSKPLPPSDEQSPLPPAAAGMFSNLLAPSLTRAWGPLLAFIAFITVFGVFSLHVARTDTTILAIVGIVTVAMVVAVYARIKNVV